MTLWMLSLALGIPAGAAGAYFILRRRAALLIADNEFLRARLASMERAHESALKAEKGRWESAFDRIQAGVVRLSGRGVVEFSNRIARDLLTHGQELNGRPFVDAVRRTECVALLGKISPGAPPAEVEMEFNGDARRSIMALGCTMDDRDPAAGSVITLLDVSRLRQLETLRREFVANVSHELRTPLSLISGFVETLEGGAIHDTKRAPRFLEIIRRNTNRLTYLIEDLLTLSSLESGRVRVELQPEPLAELVATVMDAMQGRAAARGIQLENRVAADCIVLADAPRIEQVLSNLIDNAIKYGNPDGRVTVQAARMGLKWIEVEVRDNGPGIPEEARSRVFERFFRVDPARSRETGGTGLGLSIVKHIVHSHGGDIRLASEMGVGSRFYFTLPESPEPTTPGEEPAG